VRGPPPLRGRSQSGVGHETAPGRRCGAVGLRDEQGGTRKSPIHASPSAAVANVCPVADAANAAQAVTNALVRAFRHSSTVAQPMSPDTRSPAPPVPTRDPNQNGFTTTNPLIPATSALK